MNKLTNPQLLIILNTVHSAISIFINTFMVAWFFNITNNDVVPACVFYIYSYALSTVGFFLIGNLVKCGPKILLFQLSFLVNFGALMLILYLQENIISYLWLIGLLIGAEKALFYMPLNVMTSQEVPKKYMARFNAYNYAWSGITKILVPLLFGWMISLESFLKTTIAVLVLSIISWLISLGLNHIRSYCKPFKIKYLIALAQKRKHISSSLIIDFLRGFTFEVLELLIVLYVVYMFKTNLNLGILTSIFAICTVIANIVFGKFCRYRNFIKILIVSSIFTVAGTSYFVVDVSKTSFIVYNLIYASFTVLLQTITATNVFRVSQDKSVASLYRAEYLALRELFLNTGRCLGFGLVIITATLISPDKLKYLLLGLNMLIIIVGWLSVGLSQILNKRQLIKS